MRVVGRYRSSLCVCFFPRWQLRKNSLSSRQNCFVCLNERKMGPTKSLTNERRRILKNSSDAFRDEIIAPKELRYTAICLISSRFYISK